MTLHVAPQIGTKYTLVNGSARVTFNDPTDPDNVGALTNVTGTDSPEVREDGESLVQADGGAHGPFLYGRRPIMMEGVVYGHVSDAQRNERIARLIQVSDAMATNATLSWQPTGGAPVYTSVRRQQPTKISGGWNKTFQLSLVAADPRFYGSTLNTVTKTSASASTVANAGNTVTYPVYTVYGPTSTQMTIQVNGIDAVQFIRAIDLDRGFLIDSLNRSIIGYRRRMNWYKNPSFEHASTSLVTNTSTDDFGIFATGTPTLDAFAVQPAVSSGFGTKVLKLTTTGIGGIPAPSVIGTERVATAVLKGDQSGPTTNGFKMPVHDLARPTYLVVSCSMLRASASAAYKPYISAGWLNDSASATLDAGQYRGAVALSDTVWQRVSNAFLIPSFSNAVNRYAEIQIGVVHTANQATGQIYYIDGVTVEIIQGSPNSGFFYPDGSTYLWEGTANNSRSYSAVYDPLVPPVSNYELMDFNTSTWAGLQPGNNSVSMLGTLGSGGSLKLDWRDAWL